MMLSKQAVLLLACAASAAAFAPTAFFGPTTARSTSTTSTSTSSSTSTSTVLYISSWGTQGPPSRWADAGAKENPATKIQSYLPAPDAVEARDNVDGTVLVSGLVNTKDRTDQFLFDLLNHEESAFEFEKIVCFADDSKFAKKRLLSRSARYTGLLDKLDFLQAETVGALPTASQLEGIKSWVAVLDSGDLLAQVQQIAATAAAAPSVQNVAILLQGATDLDAAASQAAVTALKGSSTTDATFTLVAVGELGEHAEGNVPYQYRDFGTTEGVIPAKGVFSREESIRMVTELLQLECGVNKALAFAEVYNGNQTEAMLIKGLREGGYARPQEIDHMIRDGPQNYKKAVEDFKTENPDAAAGYTTTDAWWEGEQFQNSRKRSAERDAAKIQAVKDERTIEIETVAKEWAKREFFRQSMSGTVNADQTEEEFTKSVWERAMFEGDLKYRQMKGEVMDEASALADFKGQQEKKSVAMLKRAKQEMKDILQEDGLGGIVDDDDDDDDDEDDK